MYKSESTNTGSLETLEEKFQLCARHVAKSRESGFANKEESAKAIQNLLEVSKEFFKAHLEQNRIPDGIPKRFCTITLKSSFLFWEHLIIDLQTSNEDPILKSWSEEQKKRFFHDSLMQLYTWLSLQGRSLRETMFENMMKRKEDTEFEIQTLELDCLMLYSTKEQIVIASVEKSLGTSFVKSMKSALHARWDVKYVDNKIYGLELKELLIKSQKDCEWFKAKLIKAGVDAADIHFVRIEKPDGQEAKYQLTVTHIGEIYSRCERDYVRKQYDGTLKRMSNLDATEHVSSSQFYGK